MRLSSIVMFSMSVATLLLMGVSEGRVLFAGRHDDVDDDAVLQPMVSTSRQRRICTELCAVGFGGRPCDDVGVACFDVLPQRLPLLRRQSGRVGENVTTDHVATPTELATKKARRDVCDVLCPNELGYPLCGCCQQQQQSNAPAHDSYNINFVEICGYFCLNHNYQLLGCQSCSVYSVEQENHGNIATFSTVRKGSSGATRDGVDWEEWCKQQCLAGDGGAACNCDILPFSAL